MCKKVDSIASKKMIINICDVLIANQEELCNLDKEVGDGDHGIAVAKSAKAVKESILSFESSVPADFFDQAGHVISKNMGGAMGPLLSTFFCASTKEIKMSELWGTYEFSVLFDEGLKRIEQIGEALPGDRTLVDALYPASTIMKQANKENKGLKEALELAAEAAKKGAENTSNMIAKKGRAKFLGEKSKGHIDAGATTMELIIEAMNDSIE